jgi:predicted regulator of Ras-like GTPase activity (Roadblock/LC7/MglB family)/Flp pilus assembly protein TadD
MAQMTEIDDRIAKCNKILDNNPNSQIFAALAEAYRKKGDIDKAFRICRSGLKIHPEYGSAHVVMAKINMDKGLYDWAEIEVQKAIELEGISRATEVLLAEIYVLRGEFVKANKLLDKLHQADPDNQKIKELFGLAQRLPERSPAVSPSAGAAKAEVSAPAAEAPETVAAAAPTEAPIQSGTGAITIEEFFDALTALPGIEGVMVINNEGLVSESRWRSETQKEEYGAIARDIEKNVQEQIGLSGFGHYENILIEAEDYTISLSPLKNDFILLIRGTARVNLGSLRIKVPPLIERLEYDF